jgi:hypothetical protein
LKEKIIKRLPKMQIGQNPTIAEVMQMNTILVQYFMEKEFNTGETPQVKRQESKKQKESDDGSDRQDME